MNHPCDRHGTNIGVLADDVVSRCVRERQHGDVSRVHATQAKLLDTSQNDCALTSTSACLSQDERFGRAHSSELLRRELSLHRNSLDGLRRTLQLIALATKVVERVIHEQVHILLDQKRSGLGVTEHVDGLVDLAIRRQRNVVLLHVAQFVDHLRQLLIVVGMLLRHKSVNDIVNVISDVIAAPALRAVRDVVVDAVLSVERRQRVKEVALTRVTDARGTEDLIPRKILSVLSRSVAPVGNGPRQVGVAHLDGLVGEGADRRAEQSRMLTVALILSEDERVVCLVVEQSDVIIVDLNEVGIIMIDGCKVVGEKSEPLIAQIIDVFVLLGRDNVDHRAIRDLKILHLGFAAVVLAHSKALHRARCPHVKRVGVIGETHGELVHVIGDRYSHATVALLVGTLHDGASQDDTAGDRVGCLRHLVAKVCGPHAETVQSHGIAAWDNRAVEQALLLTTTSEMRREVLGRHRFNGAGLGSFDSSAELGCFVDIIEEDGHMRPPFYLNKEELNKCVDVFCGSAHGQITRRPTDENSVVGMGVTRACSRRSAYHHRCQGR